MEQTSENLPERIYTQTKERILSDVGIWVSDDCNFKVIDSDDNKIIGELDTEELSTKLNLDDNESIVLGKLLISKGLYSLRSRIQQSGFNIQEVDNDSQRLRMTITNLTGKNITNVPDSFGLLRFFMDRPEKRLMGKELLPVLQSIYQDPEVPSPPGEEADWSLYWYSYHVGIIQSPTIDLSDVVESQNREQLHKTLGIRWVDFDLHHPKFYLAEDDKEIHVPDNIYLRIVVDPNKTFGRGGRYLNHLNSPIIDPGFNGTVIFEHTMSYREADIADPNYISVFVYKVG